MTETHVREKEEEEEEEEEVTVIHSRCNLGFQGLAPDSPRLAAKVLSSCLKGCCGAELRSWDPQGAGKPL